ncbi:ECF transporter S component [Halanaerobium sp. Z-7514]|uniref:ECF transporter S component n=1 Tax=Halanaerobium polyolivorans TaxID=2886943 RepID=A0AAW4X1S7_9FIRM|nr:ECF transporter S component [Halanaerobium polyolivorans]MCC3145771.1 ECF transporter S component [Halanaerobium polyolivorans]
MKIKRLIYISIFITLGIILPMIFHFTGGANMGSIFLPMHIPVFIGGSLLGPISGFLIGLITPIMSSFLTGMPPLLPILPIMIVELSIYGIAIGFLVKKMNLNIYISLIFSMVLGRIGSGISVWILVTVFEYARLPNNPFIYIWGAVTMGFLGILIQLIMVPSVHNYLDNYDTNRIANNRINEVNN